MPYSPSISIVIPWQDRGDERRRLIFEYVLAYYQSTEFEVVVGTYPLDDQPLNRSRLRNEGAKKASGDVLFFVDADTLVPLDQVTEACNQANQQHGVVLPHDLFRTQATAEQVEQVLGGADWEQFLDLSRTPYRDSEPLSKDWHVGPTYAVRRDVFFDLGGFDEEFVGWGEEEKDFLLRATKVHGPLRFVAGTVLDLGSPLTTTINMLTPEERKLFEANRQRLLRKHHPVRIAVYSPARGEAKNVLAWYESAKEADEIVLVDTGSEDDTLKIAAELAAVDPKMKVRQAVVTPWRFDDGMNAALAQVSADIDIAVPLHLDERLQPGWRDELEKAWSSGGGKFTFVYEWSPGLVFRHDRIHARAGYRWVGAAHEYPSGPGPVVNTQLRIVQVRDADKDRSQDDALIELAYRENPTARTAYYYARQHYYRNNWEDARSLFMIYLAMPDATYDQERSEACRMVAKMVWPEFRETWLLRACSEAPARREVWADLARWYVEQGMREEAAGAASRALRITEPTAKNSYHLEVGKGQAWDDDWLRALLTIA